MKKNICFKFLNLGVTKKKEEEREEADAMFLIFLPFFRKLFLLSHIISVFDEGSRLCLFQNFVKTFWAQEIP